MRLASDRSHRLLIAIRKLDIAVMVRIECIGCTALRLRIEIHRLSVGVEFNVLARVSTLFLLGQRRRGRARAAKHEEEVLAVTN